MRHANIKPLNFLMLHFFIQLITLNHPEVL